MTNAVFNIKLPLLLRRATLLSSTIIAVLAVFCIGGKAAETKRPVSGKQPGEPLPKPTRTDNRDYARLQSGTTLELTMERDHVFTARAIAGGELDSVNSRIIGSWRITGGDYPLVNEYRADGTLVQRVGGRKTEPYKFRIEGEYLTVSVPQPDGTISETKERFALKDDTLTFFGSDGSKRTFRRE